MRHVALVLFTAGVGGYIGFICWLYSGCPSEYLWFAVACVIASTAVWFSGSLWRIRASISEGLLAEARQPAPDQIGRAHV